MKKREKICTIITKLIEFLFLGSYIVGMIYIYILGNKEPNFWFMTFHYLWAILAVLYLLFTGLVCDWVLTPPEKFKRSDKYQFTYKNFDELYNDANKKLVETGYSIKKEYKISENEKLFVYMKPLKTKLLEMWLIADLNSYTKNKEEKIEKYIEEFYNEFIKTENSKKVRIKTLSLFCVKRYSQELEIMIKNSYTEGLLNLSIALSFATQEIYIASARELRLFVTDDYIDLKNEFFSVVDATKIKSKK